MAIARPSLLIRVTRAPSSTPPEAGRSHQWLGADEVAGACPRVEASRAIGSFSHLPRDLSTEFRIAASPTVRAVTASCLDGSFAERVLDQLRSGRPRNPPLVRYRRGSSSVPPRVNHARPAAATRGSAMDRSRTRRPRGRSVDLGHDDDGIPWLSTDRRPLRPHLSSALRPSGSRGSW